MFNYVNCYIVSNEKSTVSYSIEFIHAALLYKSKDKLYIYIFNVFPTEQLTKETKEKQKYKTAI